MVRHGVTRTTWVGDKGKTTSCRALQRKMNALDFIVSAIEKSGIVFVPSLFKFSFVLSKYVTRFLWENSSFLQFHTDFISV